MFPVSSPASNHLPSSPNLGCHTLTQLTQQSIQTQTERSLQSARLHSRDQSATAKAKALSWPSRTPRLSVTRFPTFHKPVSLHSLCAGCTYFCHLIGAFWWFLFLAVNNGPRLKGCAPAPFSLVVWSVKTPSVFLIGSHWSEMLVLIQQWIVGMQLDLCTPLQLPGIHTRTFCDEGEWILPQMPDNQKTRIRSV